MTDIKLHTTDSRMIKLMEWALSKKLVESESEFFSQIEFTRQNISNVKRGHQRFTVDHIIKAAQFTGANVNWIMGLETQMMRKPEPGITDRLREILYELESVQEKKMKKAVVAKKGRKSKN